MVASLVDQVQNLRAYLEYWNNRMLVYNWEERQGILNARRKEPEEMPLFVRKAYLSLVRYELNL